MFKAGDRANMLANGREIEVTVMSERIGDHYFVQEHDTLNTVQVNNSRLLPIRGPFFDVRGLVFTSRASRPNQQGEVIAKGHGPIIAGYAKTFYQIKFRDGSIEWVGEDEVLIQDKAE
jgi:hypothetical protein